MARLAIGLALFGLLTLVVYLLGGDSSNPKLLAAAVLGAFVVQGLVFRFRD